MQTSALFMMIILMVVIWGGFAYCLSLAIKKEEHKKQQDPDDI